MRKYTTLILVLGLCLGLGLNAYAAPEQQLTLGKARVGALRAYWATANRGGEQALDVDMIVNNGATAGDDFYGIDLNMQADDADADLRGIRIILDATTNAAAGSYEYGVSIDCEENTAGACTDGIVLTSTGINTGMTDAIDVSNANITNALNVGANTITGTTAVIDFTNFDVDANGAITATGDQTFGGTAGSDVTIGNSTGDVAITSDNADFTLTDGTDNVFQLVNSAGGTIMDVDLGATDGMTLGASQAMDVTLTADPTGGNAGAKSEFIGLPRIMNAGIGTMTDGSETVITDIGDSETPATDWTAIDADTTMTNDSTYYRQGTASLKMLLGASAAATDGCTNTLASGDQDWSADESVGMWVYSDTAFDANDLNLVITDSVAGDTTVQFPAYTTANTWEWMEIDISGVADASKDVIEDLSIELNAGSDLIGSEASLYFDFIVKWDAAEEETLGQAILSDGVLSLTVIDATDAGADISNLTLYTDYFVHYQSGNDAVVMITDQSGADKLGLALIAY